MKIIDSELLVRRLSATAPKLVKMNPRRAAIVAGQVLEYWRQGSAGEAEILTKFVAAVFAIDDELDSRPPFANWEDEAARFLPWQQKRDGKRRQREICSLLREVEAGITASRSRKALVAAWHSCGVEMTAAMWREAKWRAEGIIPSREEYLRNGSVSVALPWMAATMAGMCRESVLLKDPAFAATVASAALGCRLLNDLSTWWRERAHGTPNFMALGGGGEAALIEECRSLMKDAFADFETGARRFRHRTVEGLARLVSVLRRHYATGDFPSSPGAEGERMLIGATRA